MSSHTKHDALDLYAQVEDMLGLGTVAPTLYGYYQNDLKHLGVQTLLDIGCGNGTFLHRYITPLGILSEGIDLSAHMVQKARALGVDAHHMSIERYQKRVEAITAVFDVLNYLSFNELGGFFDHVRRILHHGGYFLCDINTLFGFEEVAVGVYSAQDKRRFVCVEGEFDQGVYHGLFHLFADLEGNGCYQKYSDQITQYYHEPNTLVNQSGMKLVKSIEVELYGWGEADKIYLVLQKV